MFGPAKIQYWIRAFSHNTHGSAMGHHFIYLFL
jgi:hypothetical protein